MWRVAGHFLSGWSGDAAAGRRATSFRKVRPVAAQWTKWRGGVT